jgi:protein gp37
MAGRTSIEWTQMTWNPVTGCTKVSQGCKFCYAERMANRLQAIGVPQYRNGFEVTLAPHLLDLPRRWRTPRVVFVNSMSDLFHEKVPADFIQAIFQVIRETPQHTYQILTKRSARLRDMSSSIDWPQNAWMGVSVENEAATFRIDDLRATDAKIRFLSIEPLIGPIKRLKLDGIHWVIVGGESGPRARRMEAAWVEEIQRLCLRRGVPFFFKQWGKRQFNEDGTDPTISKNHNLHAKGGCQLNGEVFRQLPVTVSHAPTEV